MIRTQIQLTEEQSESLRRLAAKRGVSMAELIRRAVDELLRSGGARDQRELRRRAVAALGSYRSGVQDLASEHDRHFAGSGEA